MLRMTPDSCRQPELRESILRWYLDCGIEPNDTYKILIDTETMMATVFQFKRDAAGQHYIDPHTHDAARLEPLTVKLSSLPPGGFEVVY